MEVPEMARLAVDGGIPASASVAQLQWLRDEHRRRSMVGMMCDWRRHHARWAALLTDLIATKEARQ